MAMYLYLCLCILCGNKTQYSQNYADLQIPVFVSQHDSVNIELYYDSIPKTHLVGCHDGKKCSHHRS